ncbi:MAG: histidine kinase [Saprospiraceae bacterium]|nr:histidine kinase [Saprospiraceae bacterium]
MNPFIDYFISFHHRHRAATHVVFWTLLYGLGLFTDTSHLQQLSTDQNIVLYLMMMISKIPIAYFVVYFVIPLYLDRKKYLSALCLFLIFYYLNFCLSTLFKINIYPLFQMYVIKDFEEFSPSHYIKDYFISNLGATALLVLIKLFLNKSEVQQKALLLDKQKSEIELKLLKSQLNPHFLFNTLNNIYTLSILNSPKTSESIARLSDILDYMLYRCNLVEVLLKNEIKLIQNYIELEKIRYDDRLKITFIEHIQYDVQIAPLILLTLVENAFKHGASEDAGSPQINIDLKATEKVIEFKIQNSITPPTPDEKVSLGIGLYNLQKQLELIYSNGYKLEVSNDKKHFSVLLIININSK